MKPDEIDRITADYARKFAELMNELKQSLTDKPEPAHEPTAGEVYQNCLLVEGGRNIVLGYPSDRIGKYGQFNSHDEFDDACYQGKFEDLYFTEDRLKELFSKMGDQYGDTAASMIEMNSKKFVISCDQIETFIHNLLSGKNCDGSDQTK